MATFDDGPFEGSSTLLDCAAPNIVVHRTFGFGFIPHHVHYDLVDLDDDGLAHYRHDPGGCNHAQ